MVLLLVTFELGRVIGPALQQNHDIDPGGSWTGPEQTPNLSLTNIWNSDAQNVNLPRPCRHGSRKNLFVCEKKQPGHGEPFPQTVGRTLSTINDRALRWARNGFDRR